MRRLLLALSLTVWLAPPSLAADLAAEQISAYGETGISSRYLLMDANGRAVSNRDFRGRFQLLTFGYTYCPDICATTLAEMAMVISRLGKEADALQALFITFDPERDSADTLRSYTAFFDPRIIRPDRFARAGPQSRRELQGALRDSPRTRRSAGPVRGRPQRRDVSSRPRRSLYP